MSPEHADLQRQIVELRMRLDQEREANAALLEHLVGRAVDARLGGRTMTEQEAQWVKEGAAQAAERKRMRSAVVLHVLQWGVGGTVGFLLYSAWESIKRKVAQ